MILGVKYCYDKLDQILEYVCEKNVEEFGDADCEILIMILSA